MEFQHFNFILSRTLNNHQVGISWMPHFRLCDVIFIRYNFQFSLSLTFHKVLKDPLKLSFEKLFKWLPPRYFNMMKTNAKAKLQMITWLFRFIYRVSQKKFCNVSEGCSTRKSWSKFKCRGCFGFSLASALQWALKH